MTWEAPQQPPAFLLLLRDLSMACTVHLAVENEQLHGAPFPERSLAALNQRLALSYFSAVQDIPAPHED